MRAKHMRRKLALFTLVLGCGSGQKEGRIGTTIGAGTAEDAKVAQRCDPANKRIVKLDLNRDDKPDVYKMFSTRDEGGQKVEFLTCKEVDINFDGRKDVWFYYDDAGQRTREEMDLDFDGKIDLVTFRQADKIVRQELDTNFDGKSDIWRHFEGEKIARVERDSDNDGKVDYWEYYEGGALDRIGFDVDGDGKIDRWDRAPPPEVPPAGVAGPSGQAAAAPVMPTPPAPETKADEAPAPLEKKSSGKSEKKKAK